MKIDVNILKDFIKKASLNGRIPTMNMKFEAAGVSSSVSDPMNIALAKTILNSSAFTEYEELGELYIRDTPNLLKYLDTFDSIITLEKTDEMVNILKLSGNNREAFVILGEKMVCENIHEGPLPTFPSVSTIKVNKNMLAKGISDMRTLLKETSIRLSTTATEVMLEIGNKKQTDYFKNIITPLSIEGEPVKVSIGTALLDLYDSLSTGSEVVIKAGTDIPTVFIEKTEHIELVCALAPLTKNQ